MGKKDQAGFLDCVYRYNDPKAILHQHVWHGFFAGASFYKKQKLLDDQGGSPQESGSPHKRVIEPAESVLGKSKARHVTEVHLPVVKDKDDCCCMICMDTTFDDEENQMFLCDGCDQGFHERCLEELDSTIPRNDEKWYCPVGENHYLQY